MENNYLIGILLIILGLIFVIFPIFSSLLVTFIIGVALVIIGLAAIVDAFTLESRIAHSSAISILLGILAIIFGILFLYGLDAVSFLVGLDFYIIAFILIFVGLVGLISKPGAMSKVASLLIIILGIIAIFLAVFAIAEPLYAALLVGLCLIVYGIIFLFPTSDVV